MPDITVSITQEKNIEVTVKSDTPISANIKSDIPINSIEQKKSIEANLKSDVPVNVDMGEVINQKENYKIKKFIGDGVTKIITLDGYIFRANSLICFLNGVLQERGISYTEAEDKKFITFITAPKNGWKGEIRFVVN